MGADASGLRREYTRYAQRVFRGATREFLEDLKGSAPEVTGETKRSGQVIRERRSGNRLKATIEFPTEGAFYTDRGRPMTIRPRPPKKALKFFWPKVGRTVFFKKVRWRTRHPKWFTKRFRNFRWAVAIGRAASRVRR